MFILNGLKCEYKPNHFHEAEILANIHVNNSIIFGPQAPGKSDHEKFDNFVLVAPHPGKTAMFFYRNWEKIKKETFGPMNIKSVQRDSSENQEESTCGYGNNPMFIMPIGCLTNTYALEVKVLDGMELYWPNLIVKSKTGQCRDDGNFYSSILNDKDSTLGLNCTVLLEDGIMEYSQPMSTTSLPLIQSVFCEIVVSNVLFIIYLKLQLLMVKRVFLRL
jgi:hypothetical protein